MRKVLVLEKNEFCRENQGRGSAQLDLREKLQINAKNIYFSINSLKNIIFRPKFFPFLQYNQSFIIFNLSQH